MQKFNSTSSDNTVYLWWIPLSYTADFKTIETTWLSDQQSNKDITLDFDVPSDQWLIFNVESSGYFRVNYDKKNWQLLSEQLSVDHALISVANRAQIMNDALNLAKANILDYEVALDLTKYLEREEDYLPWESSFSSLNYISSMLSRSSGNRFFKKHLKRIVTPLYRKLGFSAKENDDILITMLRPRIVSLACSAGIKDCIKTTVDTFNRWVSDSENKFFFFQIYS